MNEKIQLCLDWHVVVETASPTTALALLLSLYNIFEIKFTKNNHTSHLLYDVIFQDGDQLGKNLRIVLNSWGFMYQDRANKSEIQTKNSINYVNMPIAQQLQLHSTAKTRENVYSSIVSNIGCTKSPQSLYSPPSTVIALEQQFHENTSMQTDEAETMDVVNQAPPSPPVHPEIQQTPDITDF